MHLVNFLISQIQHNPSTGEKWGLVRMHKQRKSILRGMFSVGWRKLALQASCFLVLAGIPQSLHALYTIVYDGTLTQLVSGLTNPNGLALDLAGNLYVADTGNNHILKVLPDGTVSTLDNAGVFSGVSAMSSPQQLAVDSSGNLYIADSGNNRVIEVNPSGAGTRSRT